MAESSYIRSKIDKPVVLRVKRKKFQSPLEALWLEIRERPVEQPLLDFGILFLSDLYAKAEELKINKVLVQHVETVSTLEVPFNVLQSFEALPKNARFEQIWISRKGKKEALQDEALHEMYNLYDIVRVDEDETSINVQKQREEELEEENIHDFVSKQVSKDDYVYDFYAVKDDVDISQDDASNPFPLVQVDDDDDDDDGFYNDSNAEKSSTDNEEIGSKARDEEEYEEHESCPDKSSQVQVGGDRNFVEFADDRSYMNWLINYGCDSDGIYIDDYDDDNYYDDDDDDD